MTRPYAALEAEASEFYGAPCRVNELLNAMEVPAAAYEVKRAALADREDRMNDRTTVSLPPMAPAEYLASMREAMASIRDASRGAVRAVQGFEKAFHTPASLLGYKVVPCVWLPTSPPLPDEDARRIVRHSLHEALPWLRMGEVGPKPGERTHAALDRDGTLFVSHQLWEHLMVTTHPLFGPPREVREGIFNARNRQFTEGPRGDGGLKEAWVGFDE